MVDSVSMSLSLPMSKIENLTSAITIVEKKGSATKRELTRIAGLLAHCSTVIKGGRTFSCRVYDLYDSVSRGDGVRLMDELLLEFEWWKDF